MTQDEFIDQLSYEQCEYQIKVYNNKIEHYKNLVKSIDLKLYTEQIKMVESHKSSLGHKLMMDEYNNRKLNE